MSILTIEIDINSDIIGTDKDVTTATVAKAAWIGAQEAIWSPGGKPVPVKINGEVVGRAYMRGGLLVMSGAWVDTDAGVSYTDKQGEEGC